jgi:spore coat polysaccharide biosynthesis protein SpsF
MVSNGRRPKLDVTAIIQARMTSKRLPGKSMLELAGKPMLAHVIDRTRMIDGVKKIVVATCIGKENMPIIKLAQSMGTEVFVGSVDNVLERYYLAAEEFGGSYIVRVTGDNPFTDPEYASMAVEIIQESGADLCSIPNLPLGTGVEIIKRDSLAQAYKMSDKPYQREHVTPYIKEHPELFRIERPTVSFKNPFPDLRLTVDTREDFELAKTIYENLYKQKYFPLIDVISFLEKNPHLVNINSDTKQRSMFHSESADE